MMNLLFNPYFLIVSLLLACSVNAYDKYKQTNTDKFNNREGEECPLRRQSPIDFDFQMITAQFPPLVWSEEYTRIPDTIVAENNGETVRLTVSFDDDQVPILSGGPLLHRYKFAQLHFHWGTQNNIGSEHTVFNTSFPLEVHAVHIREDLTAEEAGNYFDGYAVVGYFASIDWYGNLAFETIADQSQSIETSKSTVLDVQFPLETILPQFDINYFTYSGSLTTEPYTEAVTWIFSNQQVSISQWQLDQLRNIASANHHMINNFRETQPLNGRVVTFATLL